jgi:ubiquinone/menaquinone biosynthesis C-methylase UbiE
MMLTLLSGVKATIESAMKAKVDLYNSLYSNFEAEVLARVREKTFGEDFGQNSWTTADEYRSWAQQMALGLDSNVLEIACGSGGPAVFLAEIAGCSVTGIDVNEHGLVTGRERARSHGLENRVTLQKADADTGLPFPDNTFDALICVDAANHFPHRLEVLKEWQRVLKPGGKAIWTDPVVITGPVSNEELAARSLVGYFLFVPPGVNESLIEKAGFELVRADDVTENAALVSKRWHDARADDRDALTQIEGDERYVGLQEFFAMVHTLTSERRLSRLAYLMRKSASVHPGIAD